MRPFRAVPAVTRALCSEGIVDTCVQLAVSAWSAVCPGASTLQDEDGLCATLFEHYVVHGVKVDDRELEAAWYLIAARGRMNWFRKHVLQPRRKER